MIWFGLRDRDPNPVPLSQIDELHAQIAALRRLIRFLEEERRLADQKCDYWYQKARAVEEAKPT